MKNAKIFFILLQSSATTNDTTSGGNDIAAALKIVFPSIQDAEIKALIAVCSPILTVNIFFFIANFVIQAYPLSAFAFSERLQFQTITGDTGLRCAVSRITFFFVSFFFFFAQQDLINSLLAGDHGQRVWKNCYILGISVQPEKSDTKCIVWCCACR